MPSASLLFASRASTDTLVQHLTAVCSRLAKGYCLLTKLGLMKRCERSFGFPAYFNTLNFEKDYMLSGRWYQNKPRKSPLRCGSAKYHDDNSLRDEREGGANVLSNRLVLEVKPVGSH